MTTHTAGTYARVSTDMQSKSSVADQLREARAFAGAQGWTVVAEYFDDAISGTDDERPGLAAVMRDAEARRFDVIVCESTDRLSRNAWMLPRIAAELAFRDQALVTSDGKYDSRQSSAGLLAAVQGFISSEERSKLVQRTRRGLAGRHAAKLCAGGRRYGYAARKIPESDPRFDPRNPKAAQTELVIREDEAAWVRQIFAWRLVGLSCASIAAKLTEAQVLPPGAYWKAETRRCRNWRASAVRTILQNPIYAGRYRWNASERRKVPGTGRRIKRVRPASEWVIHEMPELRIVSPEDWERVNSRFMAQPAVAAVAKRGRGPKYPLSGLLRCGVCGSNYTIQSRVGYKCGGHHSNKATCDNGLLFHRRDIEDAVQQALAGTVLQPANVAYVEQTARKLIEQELRQERAAPPRRTAEVVRLDAEIEELRTLLRGGKVRPELIQPSLHAAEERRAALLCTRDQATSALPGKVSVAITRTADRMRDELERLCHTGNAMQAASVRATVGKFLKDGMIVLRPAPDGLRLVGDLELDGSAYFADIPTANKLVPRTGVEPVHPYG